MPFYRRYNHRSSLTDEALIQNCMQQLVRGLGDFWSQDVFNSMLLKEWRQSKRQRFILKLASQRHTRRIQLRYLISVVAVLSAGRWFGDCRQRIYLVSLTRNNETAIKAFSNCLKELGGPILEINDKTLTRSQRLMRVWGSPFMKAATDALISGADNNPHVFAQQILGVTAALLFLEDLHRVEPSIIGVANDHSPTTFSLLSLANMLEIPSFYIQHAPVTHHFPPLSADLTVLRDQNSLRAYRQSALSRSTSFPPAGKIFIPTAQTKAPRKAIPDFNSPLRICIALSKYFNESELRNFIGSLGAAGIKTHITLRVHPQCDTNLESLKQNGSISSISKLEPLDTLLTSSDLFIVSNSGIALDLLRKGMPAIFADQLDYQWRDYFGLVSCGLLPELTPKEILDLDVLKSHFDANWVHRVFEYFSTSENVELIDCFQLVEWFRSKL